MSNAPSGWQAPRTNWATTDPITTTDLNRIEGNPNAIETGERTLDQALANPANVGTLRQILSWFAGRIRAITGATNWWDAPATTLMAASTHHAAATPHTGHATTAALDGHAAATTAHSAVSTATANRIILRDAAGRAQVVDGVAAADIATRGQVDARVSRTGDTMTGALTAPDVLWGTRRTINLADGTDLNTITNSGWYDCPNFLNRPPGVVSWAYLMHITHVNPFLWSTQMIFGFHDERECYIRFSRDIGGVRTWTPWRRLLHDANNSLMSRFVMDY